MYLVGAASECCASFRPKMGDETASRSRTVRTTRVFRRRCRRRGAHGSGFGWTTPDSGTTWTLWSEPGRTATVPTRPRTRSEEQRSHLAEPAAAGAEPGNGRRSSPTRKRRPPKPMRSSSSAGNAMCSASLTLFLNFAYFSIVDAISAHTLHFTY